MQFNRSSPDHAITATVLALRPMALNIRRRRQLSWAGCPFGNSRTVRQLIREDICASVLHLVRLPATGTRDYLRILVCPGERLVDAAGHLAWASPSAYVIHENRELKLFRAESLSATKTPFQLNMTVLQNALASAAGFQPVTRALLKALQYGEFVRARQATRQTVWEHHVRSLQIDSGRCRTERIVARARRYVDEMAQRVIEPLLAEMRDSEWGLVKAFLAPLNKRAMRRTRRRPTSLEWQRNRRQALETYPFLESLLATDGKGGSPSATSLRSALSARGMRTIRRAIDDGQPVGWLLARELGLEPWMINHVTRHWSAYQPIDRAHHDDPRWNLGGMLSLWTPETAPQTPEELLNQYLLMYAPDGVTPLYRSIATPISREDRRTLLQLVRSKPQWHQMRGYLRFIDALHEWIFAQLGRDLTFDLPRLLGAKNAADWQVCARRWHMINTKLNRSAREGGASADQPIHLEWPSLLTRVESFGDVTFHSLHTYRDLAAESETMRNCAATYVARCTIGESHMLHMARDDLPVGTLQVRIEMVGNSREVLLVHAESAHQEPLTVEAEQALQQFLDACNDGTVALNPKAVLPASLRRELLAPMLTVQCIDYPTWEGVFFRLGPEYFDLHAHTTGPDLIEQYRGALELDMGAKESLYQWALRALAQCRYSMATRDMTGNVP